MKRRSLLALLFASAAGPVWAQPSKKRHRIAIVRPTGDIAQTKPPEMNPLWSVFFEKLASNGYREGENLIVERFSGEGRRDRFAELARAVVATKPDIILVSSSFLARHFKATTTTIPIIIFSSDPVAWGLVDTLARPGGNITGVSDDAGIEVHIKALDYLRLAVPKASRIGYLSVRETWESDAAASKRELARQTGILVPILVNLPVDEAELRRALVQVDQKNVDGLIVPRTPDIFVHFSFIITWANERRIPVMYPLPGHVEAGGLMSYHPDFVELYARLSEQVAKVLQGANPGDIPIYQPTRFRLFINLATAREQEIDIPPTLLAAATDLIE